PPEARHSGHRSASRPRLAAATAVPRARKGKLGHCVPIAPAASRGRVALPSMSSRLDTPAPGAPKCKSMKKKQRNLSNSWLFCHVLPLLLASNRFAPAAEPSPNKIEPSPNKTTEETKAGGWKLLFDGTTTHGWHTFKKDSFPARGWVVEDGWLH